MSALAYDTREHVIDGGPCWCKPYVKHYPEGDVIVHREAWQIELDPDAKHPELTQQIENVG